MTQEALLAAVPRLAAGAVLERKPVVAEGEFVWGHVLTTPDRAEGIHKQAEPKLGNFARPSPPVSLRLSPRLCDTLRVDNLRELAIIWESPFPLTGAPATDEREGRSNVRRGGHIW